MDDATKLRREQRTARFTEVLQAAFIAADPRLAGREVVITPDALLDMFGLGVFTMPDAEFDALLHTLATTKAEVEEVDPDSSEPEMREAVRRADELKRRDAAD